MAYHLRMEIADALEKVKRELGPTKFAWRIELPWTEMGDLPISINIENAGEVSLPLSKQDIKWIKESSQIIENRTWMVERRVKMTGYPTSFPSPAIERIIGEALAYFKGINRNDVDLQLSHLALHQPMQAADDIDYDSEVEQCLQYKSAKKGPLATVLLQVPVCYSHRGGDIEVIQQDQSVSFKTSHRNSDSFFMTVFHSDCNLVRHPVIHGSLVELVFYLRQKTRRTTPTETDSGSSLVYRVWQDPTPDLTPEAFSRLSRKQRTLAMLLQHWKDTAHPKIELFSIPLDHQYSKNKLSFHSLKGIDRQFVGAVLSILGSFVELHVAVLEKYIGYDDEDWEAFGQDRTYRYTGKKNLNRISEKDWTEYLAGNFVNRTDLRLKLPPLAITVPDELIGMDEKVFPYHPSDPDRFQGGEFDGHVFRRPALIIWPRNQCLTVALCFGLEAALDIVEQGTIPESTCRPYEPLDVQVRFILAYARKSPLKAWFVHTLPWTCSDLRCFAAQPVPLAVASQRVPRLVDLCVRWNLRSAALELLKVLGRDDREAALEVCYFCASCSASCKPSNIVFVGGVHSEATAASLAKLIHLLGWGTAGLKGLIARLFAHYPEHVGRLCQLAISLHQLESHDAARFVATEACELMGRVDISKLIKSKELSHVVTSYIEMLLVMDRDRLDAFLSDLHGLGEECTPHLVTSFQLVDPILFKDLPDYRHLYVSLCRRLEEHFSELCPPWLWYYESSSPLDPHSLAASHLISSLLWLQDAEVLREFVERCCQPVLPGKRNILPALLNSRSEWATSANPLVTTALTGLTSARVQQLRRFKGARQTCWEQPDAVLDGFPQVEAFLRSPSLQVKTFHGFGSQEEVQALAARLTLHADPGSGYRVRVLELGGPEGNAFIKLAKTPDVSLSLQRELKALEAELKGPTDKEAAAVFTTPTAATRRVAKKKRTQPVESPGSLKRSKRILAQQAKNSNSPVISSRVVSN